MGEWDEASERLQGAEALFRACTGVHWELASTSHFRFASLQWAGRVDELRRLVPAYLRDADERHDAYGATSVRAYNGHFLALLEGDPRAATACAREAEKTWSSSRFDVQTYNVLVADVQIDLYEGRGRRAVERLQAAWGRMRRSLLLGVQTVRVEMTSLRARARLAAHAEDKQPAHTRDAAACVKRLAREGVPYASAWAAAYGALLAGDDAAMAAAAKAFDGANMRVVAAACRHRAGDEEGTEALRKAGVRDPERLASVYFPSAGRTSPQRSTSR
jgi:hypothetical protein